MTSFDLVVIGAGPGGYVAAIKAAQAGLTTAIVEREAIGGVCLNWGCIPTKALLKSAKVFKMFQHPEKYGIDVDVSSVKPNWKSMMKRKNQIVTRLTGGVKMLLQKNKVTIITGEATIEGPNTIVIGEEKIKAKNIILATGASPFIPPIPGLKEAVQEHIVVTSKELLSIATIPNTLTIIGGGVIGIEFATIFASLGTTVSIIEKMPQILINVDDEVRTAYLKLLALESIQIVTSATVTNINKHDVTYEKDGQTSTITSDVILLSVGMRANVPQMNSITLETNRGFVVTNESMQTNIPSIYAIGDINGKMMLAHVASAEAFVAVDHILGKTSKIDYRKVPAGVYGFPEIVWVGLTEKEAKEKKIAFKVSKFPLAANGRALAEGESDGFIKVITETTYHEVIGVHILAANATDLIAEVVAAMEMEGTAFELAKAVHLHPSVSEIVMEAMHGVTGKPIHI